MLELVLGVLLALSQTPAPELTSPLGRALYARSDTAGVLARAESAAVRAPRDVDTLITLGQALASLWRYREAIDVYTRAITLAPERAVLYRHRGHRSISTRRFDRAIADLERGAALDSTSFDIWYHLGLAYYLSGQFDRAAAAYRRCRAVAASPDDVVAVSDWLWMSLQRAGHRAEAVAVVEAITEGMDVRENTAYYHRLLFYRGLRTEADLRALMAVDELSFATVGYGFANWHLLRGDTASADGLFRQIVAGAYWPAFGFTASEVELQRKP